MYAIIALLLVAAKPVTVSPFDADGLVVEWGHALVPGAQCSRGVPPKKLLEASAALRGRDYVFLSNLGAREVRLESPLCFEDMQIAFDVGGELGLLVPKIDPSAPALIAGAFVWVDTSTSPHEGQGLLRSHTWSSNRGRVEVRGRVRDDESHRLQIADLIEHVEWRFTFPKGSSASDWIPIESSTNWLPRPVLGASAGDRIGILWRPSNICCPSGEEMRWSILEKKGTTIRVAVGRGYSGGVGPPEHD